MTCVPTQRPGSALADDPLRPSAERALAAWAARVRANREQVEQFREAVPADFYGPIASLFRVDPYRRGEPTLEALRDLIGPDETLLDIGAGGGRYALPLAFGCREVLALEPSPGMLGVLREGIAEHGLRNIRVLDGRWPAAAAGDVRELTPGGPEPAGQADAPTGADAGRTSLAAAPPGAQVAVPRADVALIAHLGYDVEEIGPFLDAMQAATRRLCVAVLLEQPPPAEADRLWPLIHGVERAALPSLPEFLVLLLARGRVFDVRLVERTPQAYDRPEDALAWLRGQLWTAPGSDKDRRLERLLGERIVERDGRYALSWAPVLVGVVAWQPPRAL